VEQRSVLLALNEYYVYDFSDLLGIDLRDDGSFGGERLDRHFDDPLCHPFLIRVDGKLAGFAIHEGRSRLSNKTGINDIAEFFVMKQYRRRGVGADAAFALFDRFHGPWEVRQIDANSPARSFWRSVIARYSAGDYAEDEHSSDQFRGSVQSFVSPRQHGRAPTE
jgi:predicted acetyltransferase